MNFPSVDKPASIGLLLDPLPTGLIAKNERNLKLTACKRVRHCDHAIDCKALDTKLRQWMKFDSSGH